MEEYKALSRIVYGAIYRGILLTFALLLGGYFIYQIRVIVLVFLLTLLFAIVLSGPVNYLARLGLPKVLSVLGVLGGFVLALWLASVAVIPVIQKQAEQFIRDLPTLLAQVQDLTINGVGISPQSALEKGRDYLSSHVTLSSVLDVSRSITEAVSLSLDVCCVVGEVEQRPSETQPKGESDGPLRAYPRARPPGRGHNRFVL
jgi:predicted PurR-regulated permease PerM